MNFKRLILIGLLLAILTIGVVSAADEVNETDDVISIEDSQPISVDDSDGQDVNELEDENNEEVLSGNSSIDLEDNSVYEIGVDEENNIDIDINEDDDDDDELVISGDLTVIIDGKNASLTRFGDSEEFLFYVQKSNAGHSVHLNDVDEGISIVIDKLKPGTYEIEIIFAANPSRFSVSKSATINVVNAGDVADITIDVDENEPFIQGDPNVINIIAPKSVIDNLNVKINNTVFPFKKLNDIKGYVDISQLGEGSYEIVVTGGNFRVNATFEVINSTEDDGSGIIKGHIKYPADDEIKCGSDYEISLRLPGNATGNLVIEDENSVQLFNQPLVNGYASFSIANLTVGYWSLNAYYTDYDYEVDGEAIAFTLLPVVSGPSRMTVGEKKFITLDFVNEVRGTLNVMADYDDYKSIYVSGTKASIPLAALDDGDVDIYMEFYGEDGAYVDIDYSLTILEVKPRLVGGTNIKMDYSDSRSYKLTLYGTNGRLAEEDEYIEITIGNEVYDIYTNSKGVAVFEIPNSLAPGKYTIKANYDDRVFVKNTLVIHHVVKFKKVEVKKSAKKLVLKATVNKKLNGKKITFKFKGNTFKITAKNGVAKLVLNKKKLDKILKNVNPGKKITYQAGYLKDVIKYTVKLKK